MNIKAKILAFLAANNITTHTIAGVVITLTTLYASVPAFQKFVNSVYGDTPSWVHEAGTALLAIYAFYHKSGNNPPAA